MSSDTGAAPATAEPTAPVSGPEAADPVASMVSGALSNVLSGSAPAPEPAPVTEAAAEPEATESASSAVPADAVAAPAAPVPSHETPSAVADPGIPDGPDVTPDATPEPAAPATTEAPATATAPAAASAAPVDPVAALVGGALAKAAQDAPVAPAADDRTVAVDAGVPAAPAPETQDAPAVVPASAAAEPAPANPVAALVNGALRKATAEAERAPEAPADAAEPGSPGSPEVTSPPDEKKPKAKKTSFFGRMFGSSSGKEKEEDKEEVKAPESTASFGQSKDGFGSPVASGVASPEELSSPEAEKQEKAEGGDEKKPSTDSGAGDAAAPAMAVLPEGGEAAPAAAEPAAAGVTAPLMTAPVPAAAATTSSAPAAAAAPVPAAAPPTRKMTASEKQASANILALLQGKPAASRAFAKPAAPRALSREDALSLRIHASSALVPNAAVISPVVRVHLVHPDAGSPVRSSGEATTPMQTAPFDLTRRRAATFAAEWQETLEVEEALGDVLGARAVVLFEVLQLPPSFTYYEERSASFPGGQPMRVAWGFLKLLRGSDGKPNMGRLKVQLYRWDDRVGVLGLGGAAAVDAAADAPEVFKEWKRALQVAPSLRRLYPAHLDVTVASSPRTDVVAALLSAPRPGAEAPLLAIAAPPAAQKSLSGVGDNEDAPRPTRRERIDRERAMGGGWRNAETRLARAPDSDREEIAEKLGRLPHETLCYGVNPKAAAAAREAQIAAEAEAATPGLSGSTSWKAMSAKRAAVKLPHARAKQEECLIPNADARTQPHLPETASEATLASFDPMGRRLAVVSREGAMYAVRVFDASTGALIAAFPGHASTVYDVQWAPEGVGGPHAAGDALGTVDFAAPATRVLTASADGAARAWRVPAMGEDAGGEAAAGAFDIVAQHACGCYSAAWHPTAPGVLATGARDGGVRLWATDAAGGAGGVRNARVIAAVASAPGVAATAMAFDRTGLRLWVGFADGVVREHRVDVTPRGGSAGEGPSVKSLRECKDLLGEPITCLRAAPTDRRLFARTVADRVAAVDVGFFAATHTFECVGGARGTMRAIRAAGAGGALRSAEGAFAGSAASGAASAGRPLARFALSPDGRWMVVGSADGSARLFDVDVGGIGVMLPAASVPPGVRVNDVAWSPAAHCVAVCAAGGARPLRLAAHSETARAVAPPPRPKRLLALSDSEANRDGKPHPRTVAAMKQQREAAGFGKDANAARRPKLPAKLTPEAVREMLAKVRIDSAAQRRGAVDGLRRARKAETSAVGPTAAGAAGAVDVPYGGGVPSAYGGAVPYGGGMPAGGFAPAAPATFAPRPELAEWQKENAPAFASAVPAAAAAAAAAFPSFDPYAGSVGGGLGAEVDAEAQPRAPAGPY